MFILIIVGVVLVLGLSFVVKKAIEQDAAAEEQLTSEQIVEEPIPLPTKPATIKKPRKKAATKSTKKVK